MIANNVEALRALMAHIVPVIDTLDRAVYTRSIKKGGAESAVAGAPLFKPSGFLIARQIQADYGTHVAWKELYVTRRFPDEPEGSYKRYLEIIRHERWGAGETHTHIASWRKLTESEWLEVVSNETLYRVMSPHLERTEDNAAKRLAALRRSHKGLRRVAERFCDAG